MVAITGATGFVGREIVAQLRAAGYEVRGFSSRDPFDFRGAGVVIHLVGIIVERGANTFEQAHIEVTGDVLMAAQAAGVRRFVHMSALGTRRGAVSRYHQTKWVAEELVRGSGVDWTIFRPSVIYGLHDQSINELVRVIRLSPVVPVLGNGESRLQPVSVEQVARCFVAAISTPASIAQTYDLCGPEPFTWNELYDQLLAALGYRKRKMHLPLPVARGMAFLAEGLLSRPPFTREQLRMLQEDNVGDPAPAQRDFGLGTERFADYLDRRWGGGTRENETGSRSGSPLR